jgi:hypothetical protein
MLADPLGYTSGKNSHIMVKPAINMVREAAMAARNNLTGLIPLPQNFAGIARRTVRAGAILFPAALRASSRRGLLNHFVAHRTILLF